MHARPIRAAAAVAAALALCTLAPPAAGARTPDRAEVRRARHRCDRTAYVVGDSRRALEHKVLPRTTDLIWAKQLGIGSGEDIAGMRHVRYLAEPGVIHESFTDQLAALMATCSPGERPLLFDFMGTNYGVYGADRIFDPTVYDEIEARIRTFYATAAPQARVVLAELTLDRSVTDPDAKAAIERYLDGYNGVLRDLARSDPGHFFFLPAPDAYRDRVTWRDAHHESAVPTLAEYLGEGTPGALDAAGVAIVRAARGNTCALLRDDRFGYGTNSELATLGAYLQDFRQSRAANRWLQTGRSADRITLDRRTLTCT